MQQAGQVPYLDQNDAHEQSLGQSDGSLPGPEQTLNQSINQSINIVYYLLNHCITSCLGFMSRSAKRHEQVWENLHVSPRTAPSKGARLCTYHHWFGRPSNVRFEPYYDLPMGISKLRALVQFRLGSHTLPIEQGRFARPAVLRHLRRCTVCDTQAVGDELHCVFDCPHFSDIRAQFPGLFQDAAGCMRMFMWHRDQKSVCHCLIALLQKAQR